MFFQYSPFEANGGLKFWGHYSSEDMISWRYEGVPLLPDSIYDCHGVYSGSAIAEKDSFIFSTRNIKMDGDYDYINNGRQSSTLHVESADGLHFEQRRLQFPARIIRRITPVTSVTRRSGRRGRVPDDPWRPSEKRPWRRTFYRSEDLKNWKFDGELTTEKAFGYMWECPDFFTLEDRRCFLYLPRD